MSARSRYLAAINSPPSGDKSGSKSAMQQQQQPPPPPPPPPRMKPFNGNVTQPQTNVFLAEPPPPPPPPPKSNRNSKSISLTVDTSPSPPDQPQVSPYPSSPRRKKRQEEGFSLSPVSPSSPQLRHQKQQWDAKRDIPQGAVANRKSTYFKDGSEKAAANNVKDPPPPPPSPPVRKQDSFSRHSNQKLLDRFNLVTGSGSFDGVDFYNSPRSHDLSSDGFQESKDEDFHYGEAEQEETLSPDSTRDLMDKFHFTGTKKTQQQGQQQQQHNSTTNTLPGITLTSQVQNEDISKQHQWTYQKEDDSHNTTTTTTATDDIDSNSILSRSLMKSKMKNSMKKDDKRSSKTSKNTSKGSRSMLEVTEPHHKQDNFDAMSTGGSSVVSSSAATSVWKNTTSSSSTSGLAVKALSSYKSASDSQQDSTESTKESVASRRRKKALASWTSNANSSSLVKSKSKNNKYNPSWQLSQSDLKGISPEAEEIPSNLSSGTKSTAGTTDRSVESTSGTNKEEGKSTLSLNLNESEDDDEDIEEDGVVITGNREKKRSKGLYKITSLIRRAGKPGNKNSPSNSFSSKSSPTNKSFRSNDKYKGKRSAEIVVNKAKLAQSTRKLSPTSADDGTETKVAPIKQRNQSQELRKLNGEKNTFKPIDSSFSKAAEVGIKEKKQTKEQLSPVRDDTEKKNIKVDVLHTDNNGVLNGSEGTPRRNNTSEGTSSDLFTTFKMLNAKDQSKSSDSASIHVDDADDKSYGSNNSDEVSEMTNPTFFAGQTDSASNLPTTGRDEDYSRAEFTMKDDGVVASKMKDRGGTPSESESSMDQSESATPLIGGNKVLNALHEAKEEATHQKRAKNIMDKFTFESNEWKIANDGVNDPFFSSNASFENSAFSSFGDPFFTGIDSDVKSSKSFEFRDGSDFVDDPPLDNVDMLDSEEDDENETADELDISKNSAENLPFPSSNTKRHAGKGSIKSISAAPSDSGATPRQSNKQTTKGPRERFRPSRAKSSQKIPREDTNPLSNNLLDAANETALVPIESKPRSHYLSTSSTTSALALIKKSRNNTKKKIGEDSDDISTSQPPTLDEVMSAMGDSVGSKSEAAPPVPKSIGHGHKNKWLMGNRNRVSHFAQYTRQKANSKEEKKDSDEDTGSESIGDDDSAGSRSKLSVHAKALAVAKSSRRIRKAPSVEQPDLAEKKMAIEAPEDEVTDLVLQRKMKRRAANGKTAIEPTDTKSTKIVLSDERQLALPSKPFPPRSKLMEAGKRRVKKNEPLSDIERTELPLSGMNGVKTVLSEDASSTVSSSSSVGNARRIRRNARDTEKGGSKNSSGNDEDDPVGFSSHIQTETKPLFRTMKMSSRKQPSLSISSTPFDEGESTFHPSPSKASNFKRFKVPMTPLKLETNDNEDEDELVKIHTRVAPGSVRGTKGSMRLSGQVNSNNTFFGESSVRTIRSESPRGMPSLRAPSPLLNKSNTVQQAHKEKKVQQPLFMKKGPVPIKAASSSNKIIAVTKKTAQNHSLDLSSSFSDIADPIQRAGVRLLSAAAVPIQTEIRRYLGKRQAEDRMWALIVIQAYARRWFAFTYFSTSIYSATRIQAVFRGWLVRDTVDDEHYCATQIQKTVRGYLATMKVYEALYNVTIIQSIVRRNISRRKARHRLECIVKIQSLYRSYDVRQEIAFQHLMASKIQALWRGYSTQLTYQFDIVDIIIVQSIVRRRAAYKVFQQEVHAKRTKAATVIQAQWRCYDCTMNYLHTMADILIVQSVVRRWSAMRFLPIFRDRVHSEMSVRIQATIRGWQARTAYKKFLAMQKLQCVWRGYITHKHYKERKAAIQIQKMWRGFQNYTDFIFTVADVVTVQRSIRQWLAIRKVRFLREQRDWEAINRAATLIQKTWRGYYAHMNMLFTLVHIIIAQSVVRRRIAINTYQPQIINIRAATKIQTKFRGYLARKDFVEYSSVRKIQTLGRAFIARREYNNYIAARKIQALVRCFMATKSYIRYVSARRIQTLWRGYDTRFRLEVEVWEREDAATIIQKTWRGFYQYSNYIIVYFENQAATTIQKHWRGFWQYSHYVILTFEVLRIQALYRGQQVRKKLKEQNKCATLIQTAIRGFLARKLCHLERLITAMVTSSYKSFCAKVAAKRIQRWYLSASVQKKKRDKKMEEKNAALVIERFFIWVRNEVEREIERREKAKLEKRKKRHRKKKEADDQLLENVWQNTVDINDNESPVNKVEEVGATELKKNGSSRPRSRLRHRQGLELRQNQSHQNIENQDERYDDTEMSPRRKNKLQSYSAPKLSPSHLKRSSHRNQPVAKNVHPNYLDSNVGSNVADADYPLERSPPTRFSFYNPNEFGASQDPPTQTVQMSLDAVETQSDVSGITAPTVFSRHHPPHHPTQPRFTRINKKELKDDYSLEEAWIDTEIRKGKGMQKFNGQYNHRNEGMSLNSSPRASNTSEQRIRQENDRVMRPTHRASNRRDLSSSPMRYSRHRSRSPMVRGEKVNREDSQPRELQPIS